LLFLACENKSLLFLLSMLGKISIMKIDYACIFFTHYFGLNTFTVQQHHKLSIVLIFCVEFQELSHLTCDLSQDEKEITVVTN
jgi:hypothetical protein